MNKEDTSELSDQVINLKPIQIHVNGTHLNSPQGHVSMEKQRKLLISGPAVSSEDPQTIEEKQV